MATSLLRLSSQIDEQIPQLLLVALVRRAAVVFGVRPLVHLVRLATPTGVDRATRAWRVAAVPFRTVLLGLHALLAVYVAADVSGHATDISCARRETTPRPLGIAAAVALSTFVFSTRLSTATLGLVGLLCVKDTSWISGVAACAAASEWLCAASRVPVLLITCAAATAHGVKCISASSATLAMVCTGLLGVSAARAALGSAARVVCGHISGVKSVFS